MSRDASGNHTLPAGNPVTAGTTIEDTWANPTMADLSAELTDSLSRSGKGGMLAPMRTVDGAIAAPAHSFSSEVGTGWYRAGAGDLRLAILGVDVLRINSGKLYRWNGSAWKEFAYEDYTGALTNLGHLTLAAAKNITLGAGGNIILDGVALADYVTRHSARINSGTVYSRRQLNFIAGLGAALSIVDDGTEEEVEVTISAADASALFAYTEQAASFTATSGRRYMLTGNSIAVTLPVAPADDDFVHIVNGGSITGTSVLRNGKTIMGLAENMTINVPNFSVVLVYRSATGDWRIV